MEKSSLHVMVNTRIPFKILKHFYSNEIVTSLKGIKILSLVQSLVTIQSTLLLVT